MAIKTSQAINGFISSDPRLTYSDSGQARFYARIGINHYEPRDDGSFRKLDPTYHDLIQFGKGAELSAERFVKGDDFVAQGYVRDYTREVDGAERTDEQFVAKRISHDPNITTYTVDRRPAAERNPDRTTDRAAERSEERSETEREDPERAEPERADPTRQSTGRHAQLGAAEPVTRPEPVAEAISR